MAQTQGCRTHGLWWGDLDLGAPNPVWRGHQSPGRGQPWGPPSLAGGRCFREEGGGGGPLRPGPRCCGGTPVSSTGCPTPSS